MFSSLSCQLCSAKFTKQKTPSIFDTRYFVRTNTEIDCPVAFVEVLMRACAMGIGVPSNKYHIIYFDAISHPHKDTVLTQHDCQRTADILINSILIHEGDTVELALRKLPS